MLKLFTAKGSIGLACEIALEEAGADYTVERLDFSANQQRQPDYLAINPKSRVPSLVVDEGVITEAPAILNYIAGRFPQARLALKGDAFTTARQQSFNAYLASWVHPAAAHRHRGYRWADDPAAIAELRRKAPLVFGEAMSLIEHQFLGEPWVFGDSYTISDPYLYTITQWLPRDGLDMADYPRLAAHAARVAARPATVRVLQRVG
jgi:glutathione S-transferase